MEFLDGIQNIELKPKVIFAISILYLINADNNIEEEEMNYLYRALAPLGDASHLIELATIYTKNNTFDEFLANIPNKLTMDQKDILIINLIDAMCVDDDIDKNEIEIISKYVKILELNPQIVNNYINVFKKRYDVKIFV